MANALRINFEISTYLKDYIKSQAGVGAIIEEGPGLIVYSTTLNSTQITQLRNDIAQNHLVEAVTV